MTDVPNREAILRRVQKLLAIAQDTRADPNEAAAAASQAEKIMRKFQLDMGEVLVQSIKRGEDLGTEDVICTAKTNGTPVDKVPPWAGWIAFNVAELHDCGYRYGVTKDAKGRSNTCVRFYGYTADVQVASWTLQYLVETVNRLCTQFRDDLSYKLGGRSVMDSYRKGVALGICSVLKKAKAAKDAEMQQAVASRALVVVKAQAVAERYGEFTYKNRKSRMSDGDAYSRGMDDGRRVDVHLRAIGGGSNDTARRLS
jgi:hypothetical protein